MRLSDYIQLSFSNLWKRRLRTFLTVFGVTIGIGALVSMVSFGKGVQKNVAGSFQSLELFNSSTVFASDFLADGRPEDSDRVEKRGAIEEKSQAVLDDAVVARIGRLKGVELVFPEVRIPVCRIGQERDFGNGIPHSRPPRPVQADWDLRSSGDFALIFLAIAVNYRLIQLRKAE
ncbi:MAG: ABC transporter permease [Clostridiales bacterium]|nr:ABC transporter permease [Clostridiales bacterium]